MVRRAVAIGVALLALGAAFAVNRKMELDARAEAAVEAEKRTRGAALEAAGAVQKLLGELEPKVVAIASLAPVQALLGAPTDDATVQNAIETEDYFRGLRENFPIVGVLTDTGIQVFIHSTRETLHADGLMKATSGERAAAQLLVLDGKPVLTAAAPVARPGGGAAVGIVIVGRPLEEKQLDALVDGIDGSITITDGRRMLLAAGRPPLIGKLPSLIGAEGREFTLDALDGWSAGARPVGSGLWIWAALSHATLLERQLAQAAQTGTFVWGAAGLLSLFVLGVGFLGGRGAASAPQPVPDTSPRAAAPLAPQTASGLPTTPVMATSGLPDLQEGHTVASIPLLNVAPPAVARPITLSSQVPANARGVAFGRYFLVHRLGAGGMGEVYIGVTYGAEGFKRTFVIKRLRPELARDPAVVAQFIDEARLSSSLVHSNIIPVFDFGRLGDEYYMAQEYILGRDLERLTQTSIVKENKTLPTGLLIYAIHQVLQALSYAHSKADDNGVPLNLVHRDVSPQNVMVSGRGEVKLLDFGIVKAANKSNQTEAGVVKGNVSYMSPEQAQGRPVDPRSDLFSLGLVLYRCMTGDMLYRGETTYELLVKAAMGPAEPEWQRIDQLGEPIRSLLYIALDPDPTKRFQSANDFLAALPPPSPTAASDFGTVIQRLCGDELKEEQGKVTGPSAGGTT